MVYGRNDLVLCKKGVWAVKKEIPKAYCDIVADSVSWNDNKALFKKLLKKNTNDGRTWWREDSILKKSLLS